jgi:hypothetical protein
LKNVSLDKNLNKPFFSLLLSLSLFLSFARFLFSALFLSFCLSVISALLFPFSPSFFFFGNLRAGGGPPVSKNSTFFDFQYLQRKLVSSGLT